jgi:hypothetical protein
MTCEVFKTSQVFTHRRAEKEHFFSPKFGRV